MKSGNVAIVGRTNVGKSTLLNALLGTPLAIVSPLPQTSRDALLGVLHRDDAQIAFLDTPGLHRPRSELGRRMNQGALDTLRSADVVLFMTTPPKPGPKRTQTQAALDPDDERLLSALPKEVPCILLLNKVDLLRDKRKLLPVMEAFHERHDFAAVIPISALSEDGLDLVLSAITERLPEGPGVHSADTLTDRPARFFVREYVREQVMRHTKSEVPHAVAITVERFVERPGITEISATIHVEKDGQKAIVVGRGGSMIKQIGIAARERLQELLGTRVHLELFVRVTPQWKDTPRQLAEIGYDTPGGRSLTHLLPGTDERRRRKPAAKARSTAVATPRNKPRRRVARRGPR